MTYAELQDALARLVGVQALGNDPALATWAPQVLNEAQDDIARLLQIPRATTTLTYTGPVTLPAGAQSWGLLAATDLTHGNTLAIVDSTRKHGLAAPGSVGIPQWAAYDGISNELELIPTPTAPLTLELVYAVIPADMSSPADQPWNGALPEYHNLVALLAAVMLHEAKFVNVERINWIKQRYQSGLTELYRRLEPKDRVKPSSEVER